MVRERKVEDYLIEQVELHGGTCEKHVSPNRKNVPDELITWPETFGKFMEFFPALIEFAETKATGEDANEGQKRDHKRRRAMGVNVFVLNSYARVDQYIEHRRDRWTK